MKLIARTLQANRDEALAPESSAWSKIPPIRLVLEPSPLQNQPSQYVRSLKPGHGKIHSVEARVFHDASSIFFRLDWSDGRKDALPTDDDPFADAAAVMFPMPNSMEMVFEGDPMSMGADDIFLNAWYWRPDLGENATNIVANGFGTAKRSPSSLIATRSSWKSGTWSVVFARDLNPPTGSSDSTVIPAQGNIPIAFAVWEGSNRERAGLKATTPNWLLLEVAA